MAYADRLGGIVSGLMNRMSILRTCAVTVLTALVLGSPNATFAADESYRVSATVDVGGIVLDIAVDQVTGTAYVLKWHGYETPQTYSLVIIDDAKITAILPLGVSSSVAVDSGTHTAYVTASYANKVLVIKGTSITDEIAVDKQPRHVAVDSNSHTVFVSQELHGPGSDLVLINNGKVTSSLPSDAFISDIVVDSTTHTAYVRREEGGTSYSDYAVITPVVNGVLGKDFGGEYPSISSLAFDPVEQRLLFSSNSDLVQLKDGKFTLSPGFPWSGSALEYDSETRTLFFLQDPTPGNPQYKYAVGAMKDGQYKSLGHFDSWGVKPAVDPVHDKVLVAEPGKILVLDNEWIDPRAPQGRDADGFCGCFGQGWCGFLVVVPRQWEGCLASPGARGLWLERDVGANGSG